MQYIIYCISYTVYVRYKSVIFKLSGSNYKAFTTKFCSKECKVTCTGLFPRDCPSWYVYIPTFQNEIHFKIGKTEKLKKTQNFKVAMSDSRQQKLGFNLFKHQKEQIQNQSNPELKDVFSLVTSKWYRTDYFLATSIRNEKNETW